MERDSNPADRDPAPEPHAQASLPYGDLATDPRIDRSREETPSQSQTSREHALYATRGSSFRLSTAQLDTMNDVGRFRTVAVIDLEQHRYSGSAGAAGDDLRTLQMQGLVQTKTVRASARQVPLRVVVLTKLGRDVVAEHGVKQTGQALYAGFVKPREVPHDAAIYRMFQAERERIERAGGKVSRIVLDYELKQRVYAPLAKLRSQTPAVSPKEYARRQVDVAQELGLKVVDGRIPLPDLRIEYETAQGVSAQVDLELATGHYHGKAMQAKAQAGFTFYAADGSAAQLSRVLEERDITVAILSL